jgi:hypothetical protein
MSKKPSLSGGGSSSGGGFVNTRPNVDPNVQGNLQLSTSVSGTDLNLVIGNSNNRDNYTKPQWR